MKKITEPTNRYNPDQIRTSNMVPLRVGVYFDHENEPSRTVQAFQKECDINYILKQHEANGLISHVNGRTPQMGDFSDMGDATYYQNNLNYLIEAKAAFMALPADLRARFGNDPGQLLDFVSKKKNRDEAIRLGLINPPAKAPEPKVEEIQPPARKPAVKPSQASIDAIEE